jgi:hypothetical protein
MGEGTSEKREMGCFVRQRYLMNGGRIFSYAVFEERWDVGREEEERCDLVFYLKVLDSPRRMF